MFDDHERQLEFVGGPFDGYRQAVVADPHNLLDQVCLPVNANVLRVIQGEAPGFPALTRSVAVYALVHSGDRQYYCYAGSKPADDPNWDRWCLRVCDAWRRLQQTSRESKKN